ncbi:MAG: hypothetical protein H0V70_11975 [Ktedonobacteraceae bacterium]|nr:hypothetical protein [Ktedonobacteraceae bacterium]
MAGASLETYRLGGHPLPHHYGAWVIIHERLIELGDFCAELESNQSVTLDLATIELQLRQLADRLLPFMDHGAQAAPIPS